MARKKWFRIIKVSVLIYCLIGIAIFMLQDYVILRPVKLPHDYNYNFDIPYKELNIAYDTSTNINIIQFTCHDSVPKGIVLYFHGNRTNIGWYKKFAPYFTKSGYEVWMIDYPGYGKSTGVFSEKLVNEWALIIYKLARAKFPPNQVIIYGKSLGTGVAARLAAVRNCRYLILETPYYSLPDVVGFYAPFYPVNRMVHYKFPTFENLPKVTDPIILIHGTADWMVPYNNSQRLLPLLKPGDKLVTVKGGTHLDLYDYPIVIATIDSLLSK
jgi:pimeloyl-ACP methyl ester carboxylesterase